MDELAVRLSCDSVLADQDRHWRELRAEDTFYRLLEPYAQGRIPTDWGAALQALQEWRDKFCAERREEAAAWRNAALLFWCAWQAAKTTARSGAAQVDWPNFQSASLPRWLDSQDDPQVKQRAWLWVRSFLAPPVASTTVYIVVANQVTANQVTANQVTANQVTANPTQHESPPGWVARLILDIIPEGAQQVDRHPADLFGPAPGPEFRKALLNAWSAAVSWTQTEGRDVANLGAMWRLADAHYIAGADIEGPSVGGAAARGWSDLLMGRIPDQGVVVSASVQPDGTLGEVDRITAKMRAIVQHAAAEPDATRRIDTFVVAGQANAAEAAKALADLKHRSITIKDLSAFRPAAD